MDKKDPINNKNLIIRELFYFFTILAAVFIVMEIIWPNIILAYFNLNYLLIIWLISGLVMLFWKK
ncbi:MAG: hypothetical protein WC719_03960 [Patescibacteria group bacterium]|jgi:hypothetical protein